MLQTLRRYANILYCKFRELFNVMDFVTLIRPYVFFMSILGYFPYSISLSTHKLVKKYFVWSMIILIQTTLICPVLLYGTAIFDQYTELPVRWSCISIFGFGLIGLWTSHFSSRSKLHFLRMVSTASRVLSAETFCSTAKWMFAVDFIKLTLFATFASTIERNIWSTIQYTISLYIFLVVFVLNLVFINSLYVIRLCFRKINISLEKLRMNLVTDEPHLLRRVYHSQKNPTLLSELKTLRRQHLELCKIVNTSNETFGLENIITIALIMTTITFNLYAYLLENTDDGKIVRLWSVHIKYIFHNCHSLLEMAVVCELLKNQANSIGHNLHRILVITFDEDIITELSSFSMQVLQQNHRVMAKGLVIDATLLTKVVGIITTYLLILIQFLLMTPC
ncbi:uncharacterized protein LOC144478850 [Augochlora pura]